MKEAMDVINAFASPLKLAWVVWLAWGVGQYFWFRHERSVASGLPKPAVAARPAARKPMPAKKPAITEVPVMGRLITPQHVTAAPKAQVNVPVAPVAPVAPVVPVFDAPRFDPSTAVIETFAAPPADVALDRLVADFEMHDARPRRHRSHSSDAPSFGAEAPHTP
jgi:hypothetical protein